MLFLQRRKHSPRLIRLFQIPVGGKQHDEGIPFVGIDGDGALLRLVSEAWRIQLAWLFDPYLAITTSIIEPLPHQISAVYEEMLPRQPMRFLLADDPGAGKTIMAVLHDYDTVRTYFPETLMIARELVAHGPTLQVMTSENQAQARHLCEAVVPSPHICEVSAA